MNTDPVPCRECGREHEPDQLTPSGLCTNCIPTPHQPPPTTGRNAVKTALADYRQRRKDPR